ncbi:inositol hexakisphosphate and diphosphoinositol-pentakisphosphate kinase, partial [Haematococcus lacustris]
AGGGRQGEGRAGFASLREGYEGPPLVAASGQELLDSTPEFDYLTHIVLRMYENKAVPVDSSQRFRVEVLLSPGAAYDPTLVPTEYYLLCLGKHLKYSRSGSCCDGQAYGLAT